MSKDDPPLFSTELSYTVDETGHLKTIAVAALKEFVRCQCGILVVFNKCKES